MKGQSSASRFPTPPEAGGYTETLDKVEFFTWDQTGTVPFAELANTVPVWVQISQVIRAAARVGGTFIDSALYSVTKSTEARFRDDWANV